jgi:protein-arginine kinase activator protein McsA
MREELARQMEEAVRTEDFETAAKIRDQLRAMAGEAAE